MDGGRSEASAKGDAKKVAIPAPLRAQTTMTLEWIAGELQIGAWTHVWNLLSRQRRKRKRDNENQ